MSGVSVPPLPVAIHSAWSIISLRPAGRHAHIRRAIAHYGGRCIAASPVRIVRRNDARARANLLCALHAHTVIFTSPEAVKAARACMPLLIHSQQQVLCMGPSTAEALVAAGVQHSLYPPSMNSEGLLNLPAFVHAQSIGLVTAPGGRECLLAKCVRDAKPVYRADVYERVPLRLPRRRCVFLAKKLATLRCGLLVSSLELLEIFIAHADGMLTERVYCCPVVVSSTRLASAAQKLGFSDVVLSQGPIPAQLAHAAALRFGYQMLR